jgi:peptide deformylase
VEEDFEGCLSSPRYEAKKSRSLEIIVKYFDEHGDEHNLVSKGFMARVFQHEIDHLKGILMIDDCKEVIENFRYIDYMKKI